MDDTVYTLRRSLTPDDHARYIELPFDLPPGTESLTVHCTVDGQERAGTLVDLGLRDPARVRGWSGGARDGFMVGREAATPGYLAGGLPPGRWAVLLASNRIPAEGCSVVVSVTCAAERLRWLAGDLHTHSVHSDGSYALAEAIDLARAAGLDYVALTDHNTSSQNLAYPRDAAIVCIPGMELTTYRGHSTLLGAVDPIDDFRASTDEEVRQRMATARERGARVVLAHPFESSCVGCDWGWSWDVGYDWVEVWNGPWRPDNERMLDWWQAELAGGRRVVGVGGSDTHRPHPYIRHGWPTTWVYSRSRTVEGILEGIGRGHVFLSYAPGGPAIELRCGAAMMGDVAAQATDGEARSVRLRVERIEARDVVRVISERGLEQEQVIAPGQETIELAWPAERGFYRAEIRRYFPQVNQTLMAAMCNPIYLQPA